MVHITLSSSSLVLICIYILICNIHVYGFGHSLTNTISKTNIENIVEYKTN